VYRFGHRRCPTTFPRFSANPRKVEFLSPGC
jgi:hypothetical protein